MEVGADVWIKDGHDWLAGTVVTKVQKFFFAYSLSFYLHGVVVFIYRKRHLWSLELMTLAPIRQLCKSYAFVAELASRGE